MQWYAIAMALSYDSVYLSIRVHLYIYQKHNFIKNKVLLVEEIINIRVLQQKDVYYKILITYKL